MPSRRFATLIIAVLCAAAALSAALPTAAGQSFAATITPHAGLVQRRAAGSTEWVNVRDVALFAPGDQLRTGHDGFALINIITGIQLEVYPATVIELKTLALGEVIDDEHLFSLLLLRGLVFADVQREPREDDRLRIALPGGNVALRGGAAYAFVGADLNAGVIAQRDSVQVRTLDNRALPVSLEDLTALRFDTAGTLSGACAAPLLNQRSAAVSVISPVDASTIRAFRAFLHSHATSMVNPQVRAFIGLFADMPDLPLADLDAEADRSAMDELLGRIDALDPDVINLANFLDEYRAFWGQFRSAYPRAANAPALPPPTCGNGQRDPDEDAATCPTDFSAPAACGNGLCEISRRGAAESAAESAINCPADCLPYAELAQSCAALLDDTLNPPTVSSFATPVPPGIGRP